MTRSMSDTPAQSDDPVETILFNFAAMVGKRSLELGATRINGKDLAFAKAAIQAQIDEAVLLAEQKENELWTTVLNKFQKELEDRTPTYHAALATIDQIRKLYRYEREQLTNQPKHNKEA